MASLPCHRRGNSCYEQQLPKKHTVYLKLLYYKLITEITQFSTPVQTITGNTQECGWINRIEKHLLREEDLDSHFLLIFIFIFIYFILFRLPMYFSSYFPHFMLGKLSSMLDLDLLWKGDLGFFLSSFIFSTSIVFLLSFFFGLLLLAIWGRLTDLPLATF